MTKISIYEDNTRLSDLLVMMLENAQDFDVTGTHTNCANAIREVKIEEPEVIIMDIDMPEVDGMEGVLQIKSQFPNVKIIMHTVFDDDERLFECLKRGADGYLLKKDSALMLINAINDVLTGGAPMSPGIARKVLRSFIQPVTKIEYKLTEREKEILEQLTRGNSYKMIADECDISIETVRRHLQNIYHKLQVQSAPAAVAKAIREQIV